MLNRGKGPAVHSLRVQTDRKRYHMWMKHALEKTANLDIHQAEIVGVDVQDGKIVGVLTALGGYYGCKACVIATGTTLGGRIFVGEAHYDGGPDGTHAATELTQSLVGHGFTLRRFKTGTPARVHRRSIDFSKLECQPGDPDELLQPFSFLTRTPMHNKVDCYIAYTNPETHKVILDNLDRSPLYGGDIQGVGPRYCPSIEDKVVRFKDKQRHPIFVEPCGEDTEEMYLQGLSSSLPEAVQNAMYRTIVGFEHLEIMRPAYAIEYDCVDPTTLKPTLESKVVAGIYGARTVQRHFRLRGGRRPGSAGRAQRRPPRPGQIRAGTGPAHQLPGHPGGRPGDQGRAGPLPHDDQPQRIPSFPAAGQRRRAPDPHRPGVRPGGRRTVGGLLP